MDIQTDIGKTTCFQENFTEYVFCIGVRGPCFNEITGSPPKTAGGIMDIVL